MELNLHERLEQEHIGALLVSYSGDYETWLEEHIEQLESSLATANTRIAGYESVERYCEGIEASLAEAREEIGALRGHISLAPVGPHLFVQDYEEWRKSCPKKLT